MSAPTADRPLHDGHPAVIAAAPQQHRRGGFRVADILNSPESDRHFTPSTYASQPRSSVQLPMSEDRTLPPPTFGGHQHSGVLTPGGSAGSATASSTSGLITPGTISASASSSNLMTMQGSNHGYHPYASGYSAHLHHLHGSHGDAGIPAGGIRKHRSSARSGYTTAPVSVATSPINSRPTSPTLHPTIAYHGHHTTSRKMAPYASADGASQMMLSSHHHSHHHHYHHHPHHQIGQIRHSLPVSRRSAPSSPRLGVSSLAPSASSSSLSHAKQYCHPHPRMHSQRDSHLAHSVREAFGMTPIHVPGSQPQLAHEGDIVMDMELDVDPSKHHIALPPLKRTRTDDGSIIPSLSAMMSRSEPSSRKVSVSPRIEGDDRTEGMGSSPSTFGLELPPLLLAEQKPAAHSSAPSENPDEKPTSSLASRVPGSRVDLTSLASSDAA